MREDFFLSLPFPGPLLFSLVVVLVDPNNLLDLLGCPTGDGVIMFASVCVGVKTTFGFVLSGFAAMATLLIGLGSTGSEGGGIPGVEVLSGRGLGVGLGVLWSCDPGVFSPAGRLLWPGVDTRGGFILQGSPGEDAESKTT